MKPRTILFAALVCGLTYLAVAWPAPAAERQCEWTNVTRIVAVGDIHGDCDQFVKCLQAASVVDGRNKWIAGKTHLVQVGDVLDRGPTSKSAMDLLMSLEQEAKEAGGAVHALIGNHEAMVLAGEFAFLHPAEAAPYGGREDFMKAMSSDGKYGKWIRSHNAVIRINDILFLHGGISSRYAAIPLEKINKDIEESLGGRTREGAATDQDGPLWFRGLAEDDETRLQEELEPAFKNYHVRHVVVGHTVVRSQTIQVNAGGAVIMIDVGMSRTYRNGPAMCLLIENGKFYAVTAQEKKELPVK